MKTNNIDTDYGFEETEQYAEQGENGGLTGPDGYESLNEKIEWARGWVRQYMKESGKSQNIVSTELNISSSMLSQFLSDTYRAPQTVVPKVEELAALHEKREAAPVRPGFVETTVTRRVMQAIEYAHLQGVVTVVYGDAGIGKTETFRRYLSQNSHAVGITIIPTYSSIAGVNELLADKLGVHGRAERKVTLEIIEKLQGSGRVIIVDEAQHLTKKSLEHLRSISDLSGIGICLIGNEEVYRRLMGSGREDFSQLFSRSTLKQEVYVKHISREDVREIFERMGVDEKCQDVLYTVCRTLYGLRGAVNVYIATAAAYGEITPAHLAKVIKEFNIGGAAYGG